MAPLDPPNEEPNPVDAAAARIGTPLNAKWRLDGSDAESYFLAATQAAPSIATEVPDPPVEVVARRAR